MMKTTKTENRKAKNLPLELVLILLMSTSMVYPFVTALELGQSIAIVMLFNLVCIALCMLAFYNNRNLLIAIIVLAVAGCAAALLYLNHNDAGTYSAFHYGVDDFLYWARLYLSGYRSTNPEFARAMVMMFSAFVCLVVTFFTVRTFSLAAVVSSGAACFAALFIIGHIINMPSLFLYIFAATLYFLLHNYMRNENARTRGPALNLPLFMASALPLASVVLALTMLLSGLVQINPAWMKETRDKLLKKSQPVNEAISKGSGTLVLNNDELGGNLYLNDDVVMVVASPVGNVYLRSLSKDEYTGHSWEQTDITTTGFDNDTSLPDTYELAKGAILLSGLMDQDHVSDTTLSNFMNKLFPTYELTVKYTGIGSGIIYAPLKLVNLSGEPGNVNIVGGDELTMAQSTQSDLNYTVRFEQPQYGSKEFAALARKSNSAFYQKMIENGQGGAVATELFQKTGSELNKYLELPENLPARVKTLSKTITQKENNDYDKAVAIAKYLGENYYYTLTPGSVDKNRDFVDQFLFVNKQGYCTYYASAMAVLLRCAGIPSRYVEGYVLPQRDPGTGLFNVTKRQGHAWVEAYFQGLGWIQFEPTASFSNAPQPISSPKPTSSASPKPTAHPAPTAKHDQPTVAAHAMPYKVPKLPLLLLGIALVLAAMVLVPHTLNTRLKKISPKQACIQLFGQYVKLLAMQGIAMQNGETSAVFAERVDHRLGISDSGFQKSAEVFQLARYSEHEIIDEQKSLMLAFRATLLAASRHGLGWPRYLFFKYVWFI